MTNFDMLDLEVPHEDGSTGVVSIDTGSPYGFELSPRLWRQWKNTQPHARMTIRSELKLDALHVGEETLADKINIGPLILTNVPIMEGDSNLIKTTWNPKHLGDKLDGTLGLAALRHLDLVADGIHNTAYLRAKAAALGPYAYNHLGADFVPTEEHPYQGVARVVTGSPAYDAGIRNGDIVLQVDRVKVIGWTDDWRGRFELPAGTQLHFTLQRNGTNFETTATLRDILQP